MSKKKTVGVITLALAGIGLYHYRKKREYLNLKQYISPGCSFFFDKDGIFWYSDKKEWAEIVIEQVETIVDEKTGKNLYFIFSTKIDKKRLHILYEFISLLEPRSTEINTFFDFKEYQKWVKKIG